MLYEVQIVADHELPEGIDHVILERADAPPLLVINGRPARVWAWMRAWEETLEVSAVPSVLLPTPRKPWLTPVAG